MKIFSINDIGSTQDDFTEDTADTNSVPLVITNFT